MINKEFHIVICSKYNKDGPQCIYTLSIECTECIKKLLVKNSNIYGKRVLDHFHSILFNEELEKFLND